MEKVKEQPSEQKEEQIERFEEEKDQSEQQFQEQIQGYMKNKMQMEDNNRQLRIGRHFERILKIEHKPQNVHKLRELSM